MQRSFILGIVLSCVALRALAADAAPTARKLIEYGWDTPSAKYVRENIREMEKRPFDGVIFHLSKWPDSSEVFTREKWDETAFQEAFEDCKNIRWEKFTDNFISVLVASNMDWFSDADWESVQHNLGILLKAAELARCRGLCFDAEAYGTNPWTYPTQQHAKEKSFAEYEAKVRQRGAEFMRTINARLPHAVIHAFYLLSACSSAADEADPIKRERLLMQHSCGLYPAFINGMLEAAGPGITLTDGNEPSYYYTKPAQFAFAYDQIKGGFGPLLARENAAKYRRQVQVSQALSVDYVFGMGVWAEQRPSPAQVLAPADQIRWFESNLYYAFKNSDEFVWLYSENMNWWKKTGEPSGLQAAIENIQGRFLRREDLGFSLPELPNPPATKKQ
jgi:hypothetical protein